MRSGALFLCAFIVVVVPAAAGQDLNSLVSEAATHVAEWSLTPADSIAGFIEHSLSGIRDFEALVTSVGQRFDLNRDAARLIVIAELRDLIDLHTLDNDEPDQTTRRRMQIEVLYRAALEKAPANRAIVREYAVMVHGSRDSFPDADDRIVAALASVDNRGDVALEIMNDVRAGYTVTSALINVVFRELGVDPLALCVIAEKLPPDMAAQLYERAIRLWIARGDQVSAAAAAEGAIDAYAGTRRAADVLRIYGSLSGSSKAVLGAPAAERVVRSRTLERRIPGHDVRLVIAAADILAGDRAAARQVLDAARSGGTGPIEPERKAFDATRALLTAAIDPPTDDVFEIVTTYLQDGRWPGQAALIDEVLDLVASRAGYRQVARWQLDRDDEAFAWSRDQQIDLPDAVQRLIATSHQTKPARTSNSADAKTVTIERIGAPRLNPFVELPPDHDTKQAASRCDVLAELKRSGVSFPANFHPLRAEELGDEIVAVGVSHDLDPTGEISGGGYWVLRSRDHGQTWESLYTGLREFQPYELVIDSTIPLILPDGIRLEVNRRQLDESSITFPPIALRMTNEKSGLVLDFPWSDLERDSDADGVTDLVEERIFTDPHSPDSDGDGIDDRRDPLPQIAFRQAAGPEAAIVAAVLGSYYGEKITRFTADQATEESCESLLTSRSDQRTIFIVGNPQDFGGVQTSLRAVVVSEAEMAEAQKKFGRTLAVHISPIVIDHSGTRAWVDINDEWRGATYRLEKQEDGNWTVETVGSWIT